MDTIINPIFYLIILFLIALWNEFIRDKHYSRSDIEKIYLELTSQKLWPSKVFGFLQRILDYVFNKFFTRQILNPYFLFPFSFLLTIYLKNKYSITFSNLILLLTFISIVWYSKETLVLRKEQNKSNEILAGRPLIITSKNIGNYISVKNFGNSIAKNVKVNISYDGHTNSKIEFLVLGKDQEVRYPISPQITNYIDKCDKNLLVTIEYRSFNLREKFRTTFKPDASILIDSEKGRFKLINDEKIKIV